MDKLTKLQFEKLELQAKNEELQSKINNLQNCLERLAKEYRTALKENDDKKAASRTWKKRYYRLKKTNSKNSNDKN